MGPEPPQGLHPQIQPRIAAALGGSIAAVERVKRGYTPALRLIVHLADGSSVFAKVGVDDLTSAWLHRERHIYESLSGSFLPEYLGWDDDGRCPILLLEDLSDGFQPPPWNDRRIRAVLDALAALHASSVQDLPSLAEEKELTGGWLRVAEDPKPFLSLGLATNSWLERALPAFLSIRGEQLLRGEALLHADVRSDNICFSDTRAVLVDWNWACIGNPDFDVGAWLPSLESEGGPPPETILPAAGEIAALVSGYFASKAGLPPIPSAPHVRKVQWTQLRSALPWTVRTLDLPPLDGPAAKRLNLSESRK